jgi:PAS domain S-box-containing protein
MNLLLPPHDTERLHTLHAYQILDTPPEIAFNHITALAAQLFQAPLALVSLVDVDRQWVKASFGIDLREVSRELSFCAVAIHAPQVLVVPDATLDPRFVDNALVTGPPYIRAYAGAPLRAPDGQHIGSLCVIDTIPRQFSPEQQAMLVNLAAIVVDELELRRTVRELREREATLRSTLHENSQLATAVANLMSGVVIADAALPGIPITLANAGFYAMTGYTSADVLGKSCRFLQGPETDPTIAQAIRDALAARRPYHGVILNYRKDGTPFLNELSIAPVFDAAGELTSFVGLQTDVTEREQATQLLEQRVRERTADLAQSQIEILSRLARAAEFRDDDTGQHTQRVAHLAARLAQALGLPDAFVALLRQAAPLHDVGKIAISDLILLKPGKLTEAELATMRTHAAVGAALLSDGQSEVMRMAERIAGTHHERWDGSGYPRQLAGEAIPLEGRILAVADVFDALTHDRPYKSAWLVAEAVAEIARQRGTQFDPQVVDAFLTLSHKELI